MSLRALWITTGSLSILLIVLVVMSRSPSAGSHAPPPGSYLSQFREDLRDSIRAGEKAKSYEEWKRSGFTPQEVFKSVRDLASERASHAFCEALQELPDEKLLAFSAEIRSSETQKFLPCRLDLLNRIQAKPERGRMPASIASVAKLDPTLVREISVRDQLILSAEQILNPGEVVICISNGPHEQHTQQLLDVFKARGVRAVFLSVGKKATAQAKLMEQAAKLGHSIGALGENSLRMTDLSLANARKEIEKGQTSVALAKTSSVGLFRFPFDQKTPVLFELVREYGMTVIQPDVIAPDWKIADPEKLAQMTFEEVRKRGKAIVSFDEELEQTTLAMPYFLNALQAGGFKTVIFTTQTK